MESKAQAPAVLGAPLSPAIEWTDIFWANKDMAGNTLSQDNSSQDWHYDVIEYKKNGHVAGYIAVGFSHYENFTQFTLEDAGSNVLSCYTALAPADGCAHLLASNEVFGLVRQTVAFYDLNGTITDFHRYNLGEFYGVVQDNNEDIYLFGWGSNPRNITEGVEVNAANEPQLGTDPLNYVHFTVNSDVAYKYYYHSEAPDMAEITPGTFVAPIYLTAIQNCPSNYTTGLTFSSTAYSLATGGVVYKKAEYEGLSYTYNQLIDNGNTNGTVTDIELTWPQDAWDLRDNLMLRAPYNSEAVLTAAIERNIMPHAMLLEVLLANPDALVSGKVIDYAKNIPNPPLPLYMIDLLYSAQNQTTMRTTLESTIADLHLEVQRLQKNILLTLATTDSTYDAPDSTLYYLKMVKSVEGNYSRADALADRNRYADAIALIDSMQIHYKLSDTRMDETDELKVYYGFLKSVNDDGRNIADLKQNEISVIKSIAEDANAGRAAIYAQNDLCFHYYICYDDNGIPKSNALPKKPRAAYNELITELNTSTAYPNPADPYITIGFNFLLAHENSVLLVFDNLGKQIRSRQLGKIYQGQELLDTRKLPDGMYIYQLVQDGKVVSDGKFIVTH